MRKELRGITESDYWVYGLSESDFEYTVSLARGLVQAKKAEFTRYEAETRTQLPEEADDILDDVAYYNWIDVQYVWHFCLWRLQAVFEGLLVYRLIPEGERAALIGLRAKLDAVQKAGYALSDEAYSELLSWAKVRNALSHAPPEQFRPGPLEEADVLEYQALVAGLWAKWGGGEPRQSYG
jgi:hypothetical protein